jgi:hypothetical protein
MSMQHTHLLKAAEKVQEYKFISVGYKSGVIPDGVSLLCSVNALIDENKPNLHVSSLWINFYARFISVCFLNKSKARSSPFFKEPLYTKPAWFMQNLLKYCC